MEAQAYTRLSLSDHLSMKLTCSPTSAIDPQNHATCHISAIQSSLVPSLCGGAPWHASACLQRSKCEVLMRSLMGKRWTEEELFHARWEDVPASVKAVLQEYQQALKVWGCMISQSTLDGALRVNWQHFHSKLGVGMSTAFLVKKASLSWKNLSPLWTAEAPPVESLM